MERKSSGNDEILTSGDAQRLTSTLEDVAGAPRSGSTSEDDAGAPGNVSPDTGAPAADGDNDGLQPSNAGDNDALQSSGGDSEAPGADGDSEALPPLLKNRCRLSVPSCLPLLGFRCPAADRGGMARIACDNLSGAVAFDRRVAA